LAGFTLAKDSLIERTRVKRIEESIRHAVRMVRADVLANIGANFVRQVSDGFVGSKF
jgi:hypothetical protein